MLGAQNPVKACQITISMYNLYQGYRINWYLDNGVERIVPVNFVNEENVRVPNEFKDKIEVILNGHKIGKEPDSLQVAELLTTVEKGKLEFVE